MPQRQIVGTTRARGVKKRVLSRHGGLSNTFIARLQPHEVVGKPIGPFRGDDGLRAPKPLRVGAPYLVFNWKLDSRVAVKLDQAGLHRGDAYEIRDVQNFFGSPVAGGIYRGETVDLPMVGQVAARPVGNIPVEPTHTGVEFGVFVVVKKIKQ